MPKVVSIGNLVIKIVMANNIAIIIVGIFIHLKETGAGRTKEDNKDQHELQAHDKRHLNVNFRCLFIMMGGIE